MRATRFALLLVTATALVIAARFVVSARQAESVITACVQNSTGAIRIASGSCKNNESLIEWNMQGPQGSQGPSGLPGPMGPMGPAGPTTAATGTTGLQVVDSHGTVIGPWESQTYVALTINSEIVFVGLDLSARTFLALPPTFYYTDGACATTPMMYLDMTHYGSVQNGVVSYPTGNAIATSYASFNSNEGAGCEAFPGSGTFGAIATASVASFVAPFSLSR